MTENNTVDETEPLASPPSRLSNQAIAIISAAAGVIYFFSNQKGQSPFDYTFRVAENFLRGSVGFVEKPPSWLNEFVLVDGFYYSVFSLGSVISMLPFAILKAIGFVKEVPPSWIVALLAVAITFFLLKIASRYDISRFRQIVLSLAIVFGTFMWANLVFGGAWQVALGFAMVGELGAIYFTVYNRRPILAGLFFAMAFGNRTEILLTAPVFIYLLSRTEYSAGESSVLPKTSEVVEEAESGEPETDVDISTGKVVGKKTAEYTVPVENPPNTTSFSLNYLLSRFPVRRVAEFCLIPFILGVATLGYNYIRFQSFSDFGHARIPGVLEEPWYNHGIFSVNYIPRQAFEMIVRATWDWKNNHPYLHANGFGGSILLCSPFLLFCLRDGARDIALKYAGWAAILFMTIVLWMHGNAGGWQFSYRYAMVLLPWIFVIILETSRRRPATVEWVAYALSFAANIYATWLYHWGDYMKV